MSSNEKSSTNDHHTPSTNNVSRQMQPPPKPAVQPPRPPLTPNQPPQQRPGTSFQGRPNPQPYPKPPIHTANAAQQALANNKTHTPPPNGAAPTEPVSFFSARSIPKLPEDAPPDAAIIPTQGAKLFNPRLDSPSIRKTPGIDHNSSKPVSKSGQHVPPTKRDQEPALGLAGAPAGAPTGNNLFSGPGAGPGRPSVGGIGNPALSQARQIGAPGVGSPMGNRGQYRPLTVKRPAPTGPDPVNRTPLTEVTNNGSAQGAGMGAMDVKRQRMS